jgi:hypothetical protein
MASSAIEPATHPVNASVDHDNVYNVNSLVIQMFLYRIANILKHSPKIGITYMKLLSFF